MKILYTNIKEFQENIQYMLVLGCINYNILEYYA